jgi:AcrR family transcriptional regulator
LFDSLQPGRYDPHVEARTQPRRARLSRRVLDVVEPLLEEGVAYADLSVEQIIGEVGIARSTFYVYYKDKGDLLQAMAQDVTADLRVAGSAWFSFEPGSREQLREALTPLFDTYRRHRTVLGAIVETAAYDPGIRERHAELVEAAVGGLADHIARHSRADLDPRLSADWLVAMFERGLYLLVAPAEGERVEELLDAATDLVWRLLYA